MERINAVFRDCISKDVLRAIFDIHFPTCGKAEGERYIVDLTWGKGAFWGDGEAPVVGFDIAPRLGCEVKADAVAAPIKDEAFVVAILDPPHIHAPGKSRRTRIADDYGGLPSQKEIRKLYVKAAPELRRIAKTGAILKCTDMVESGKFQPNHALIIGGVSEHLGWPVDIAILDSGVVRPTRPGHRVLHLRHAHSYFLVYKWEKRRD